MELNDLSSFVLPAEFAQHARCWMAWPGDPAHWDDQLDQLQTVYAEVATAIAAFEPVTLISHPEVLAEASLRCGVNVAAVPMAHSAPWLRDAGLSFLFAPDGTLQGVYPDSDDASRDSETPTSDETATDVTLARSLLQHLKLEGRGLAAASLLQRVFVHDGEGTAIVCEQALTDLANCGISGRQNVEAALGHLGIEKVIWLARGLAGDKTGAAVDNLVCFAAPGVVLALTSADSEDENYLYLSGNLAALQAAEDAKGRSLEVIEVPQPPAQTNGQGERLPLSYLNLYIANGGVVVPGFEEAEDSVALQAITSAFPERKVVQVLLRELTAFGGGIHRMTLSQPAPFEETGATTDGAASG